MFEILSFPFAWNWKKKTIPISFDNFIEEESIVVVLLGFWAFNIRKEICYI
jgi:hypothetical protein